MDGHRVGIVIPALNEEASIGRVVETCLGHGTPIVVDDGSIDDTVKISKAAGAEVVSHPTNRGYDAALCSGFEKASTLQCDYVITIDADGQHDPGLLFKFTDALFEGADVVVGIRDRQPRISESVFAYLTKMKYGIADPLCGLKGYRIGVYRALGHFDSYNSIGTELLLFASRSGFRIEQVPILTELRQGAPRFAGTFGANYKILRALMLGFLKVQKKPGR